MAKKISKKIRSSVRYVALEALERVERGGAYSNLLLNEVIAKNQLAQIDNGLLTELVYGTIARRLLLEYDIAPFIAKAKKVEPWVKTLLCLSVYQFLYLDRVPEHAVINEAVEIAKAKGNPGTGKFVNGVLRNIQRQGVPSLEKIKDPLARLATEISMPLWLTEKFVNEIGEMETRKLGLSLFEHSRVSARVDTRFISREEAISELQEEGIEAQASEISPYGIIAEKGFVAGSLLFENGCLTLQDESSMLVAPALDVEPGQQVLDACAAPGGKTTHIASLLNDEGQVTALDIHQHKIKLIQENAERMHVADVVKTLELDARKAGEVFQDQSFDRILIDAPCSGLGLMRRKPDIKYHKQPQDFEKLPAIQMAILESCAPLLKADGILVYSICTTAPEENQQVVTAFLQQHPEFQLETPAVASILEPAINEKMLTIYPQMFQTDGFFISCMRKKADEVKAWK